MNRYYHSKDGSLHFEVKYVQAHHYIYGKWQGYVSLSEMENMLNEFLSLLEGLSVPKYLSDHRLLKGPYMELEKFLLHHFVPQARTLGISYIAIVKSLHVLARISDELFSKQFTATDIRSFNTYQEALNWLIRK